jgi:hypothetical protein
MSIVKTLTAAAVVAVVLGVVPVAASAQAPVWEYCTELSEGLYENSECSTKGTAKSYQWLEANSGTQPVSAEGTLKLTAGEVTLECVMTSKGTVGGEEDASTDETTEVSVKSCKDTAGKACESPTVEVIDLPWKTELEEPSAGEVRDLVKGSKPPGWKVSCKKEALVTCEGDTSEKLVDNEKGLVEAELEAKSERPTCSKGKGEITGKLKVRDTETGVGALRAFKAGNFSLTRSKPRVAQNESVTFTIKARVAAEVKEPIIISRVPAGNWSYLPAEVTLCIGKYAALESCKFVVEYKGNAASLLTVLVFDENDNFTSAVVLGT